MLEEEIGCVTGNNQDYRLSAQTEQVIITPETDLSTLQIPSSMIEEIFCLLPSEPFSGGQPTLCVRTPRDLASHSGLATQQIMAKLQSLHCQMAHIYITPSELSFLIGREKSLILLDVSHPSDRRRSPIEGSIYLQYGAFIELKAKLEKVAHVVTLCQDGHKALSAALYLQQEFGQNGPMVHCLKGGLERWSSEALI